MTIQEAREKTRKVEQAINQLIADLQKEGLYVTGIEKELKDANTK